MPEQVLLWRTGSWAGAFADNFIQDTELEGKTGDNTRIYNITRNLFFFVAEASFQKFAV